MAENLLDLLPRRLRPRFEGLGSYVTSVLDEEFPDRRIGKNELEVVQFVAFVGALDQFLRDGTTTASQAVDAFASLGVGGFRVGSQHFSARNEAVMRGANLSERLRRSIPDRRLLALLEHRPSLRQLVVECARIVIGA
jgi:hypothetical protein